MRSVLPSTSSARIEGMLRERLGNAEVAPHVAKSWLRCIEQYGIDADAARDTPVLDAASVGERQQRFGELLNVARAEMENLYEQIAGSGYAVILCDADAAILGAITDPTLKREFRAAGLRVGAIWSERYEGTNGLGTCIAEGGPVTIYREEHFRHFNMDLSCSGAPVLDTQGDVLAVLDASTVNAADTRLIQRHTMALVAMSANLISRCHFLAECRNMWVLRFHSRPEFVGLLHEALLAVDGNGVVRAVNESALTQLGLSRDRLVGQPLDKIFAFDFNTLEKRAFTDAATLWPVRDAAYGRRFFAMVRPPVVATSGIVLTPVASSGPAKRQHVGSDTHMQHNMNCGRQLFGRRVPLLLQGATGTGKEAFAKALHLASSWADKPFVAVNCAAIPETLIESELFGYTRGAFTDASRDGHLGKIRQSSGGTLFLDEIGDMPLPLQTRLLRVLEEHEVMPLGGERAIPVDLHVISATHQDLQKMVQAGEFREDLYYRLNGITLQLPLLRERSDKLELIETLLTEESLGQARPRLCDDALRLLLNYAWPGNIRQLRNTLRTAAALCGEGVIRPCNLPQEITGFGATENAAAVMNSGDEAPLRLAEREALLRELEQMHWNISRTATALGISRNTLYRKLHKHGIAVPD
ncbi:MAG TPA: sigma-54-dependent Fis family transcriptional regulator [Dyella sp.]|uniref:sigma-54-dependent Fis family transcriptional regulator n=1 Tax=Dyella sp. TaxID=1869338 RepID=UPI002F92A633